MRVEYLKQTPTYSAGASERIKRTVSEMLARIEQHGIEAVRDYSWELDNWAPVSFLVGQEEIRRAQAEIDPELAHHIAFAQEQVRGFAEAQRATLTELEIRTLPGVVLGHRHIPVDTVGSYVPGGRYPMLASAFMTVLVPRVAGVRTVIACAPPREGQGIDPAMLYAIATSGADHIACLGGVQALAALAFGLLEDLPAADMLVGPGNPYVAEAKRQLYGTVGIDLLAGPTEIAIIADHSAHPELVAADLLGQAEHGPTSPAVLISTSRPLAEAVLVEVARLLESWPTREVAGEAWRAHGQVALVESAADAVALSDTIAPEHLEVHVEPQVLEWYLRELRNYGSLFLGEQATVAFGDKASGPNHVLPTQGAARYTGGLWVGKFLKTCTYQRMSDEGTRAIAPTVATICHAERFEGHALTATMRLARLEGQAGA
jgi:sulfopropanediol 3-dehydrogenase